MLLCLTLSIAKLSTGILDVSYGYQDDWSKRKLHHWTLYIWLTIMYCFYEIATLIKKGSCLKSDKYKQINDITIV